MSAGLDPLNADSDDDGYPDGAEIDAGSDPLDNSSWVYEEAGHSMPRRTPWTIGLQLEKWSGKNDADS